MTRPAGQPRGAGGVPPTKAARAATDGAAGILLCGVMALVVALTLGLGRLTAASLAAARAQTAADAAALAAAGELAAGRTAREAERTAWVAAAANGARLLRCDCGGPAVFVAVSVVLPFSRPVSGLVRAAARAELHPECPG